MDDCEIRERSEAAPTITRLDMAGEAFGYRTLRLFFLGGLLLTVFLVVLSAVSDPGPDPVRRFALLTGVLVGWCWACRAPVPATDVLRRSPWLVLVLAGALIVSAAFDGGLLHSTLESEEYVLLGIAVFCGGGRCLVAVSLLLSAGMLASLPFGYPSRRLFTEPVLSDLVTLWAMTAVLGAFLLVWRSMCDGALDRLSAVRAGAPALTPALSAAITGLPLLPAGTSAPIERLTDAEVEVVQQLARGVMANQVAARSNRSIYTIRAHIRSAKRKTGARTIPELVALVCEAPSQRT